ILSDSNYPDSAEALEDSEFSFIPAKLFKNMLKQNNSLCLELLKGLSLEFERFIGQETMLAQKTVFQRVCTVLFFLSELYHDTDQIIIPLSRNDLSDLSGTVKETLVRVLHDLKEERVIESIDSKGTLLIKDIQRLKKLGEIVEAEYQ
ncbi:MAG: Crp/Fnr family transcriptional regulator, partial [Salibacteraceae bacterium]